MVSPRHQLDLSVVVVLGFSMHHVDDGLVNHNNILTVAFKVTVELDKG